MGKLISIVVVAAVAAAGAWYAGLFGGEAATSSADPTQQLIEQINGEDGLVLGEGDTVFTTATLEDNMLSIEGVYSGEQTGNDLGEVQIQLHEVLCPNEAMVAALDGDLRIDAFVATPDGEPIGNVSIDSDFLCGRL